MLRLHLLDPCKIASYRAESETSQASGVRLWINITLGRQFLCSDKLDWEFLILGAFLLLILNLDLWMILRLIILHFTRFKAVVLNFEINFITVIQSLYINYFLYGLLQSTFFRVMIVIGCSPCQMSASFHALRRSVILPSALYWSSIMVKRVCRRQICLIWAIWSARARRWSIWALVCVKSVLWATTAKWVFGQISLFILVFKLELYDVINRKIVCFTLAFQRVLLRPYHLISGLLVMAFEIIHEAP